MATTKRGQISIYLNAETRDALDELLARWELPEEGGRNRAIARAIIETATREREAAEATARPKRQPRGG